MALPIDIKRLINGIYAISNEDCVVEIYKRVNNVYEELIIYNYSTEDVPYFLYTILEDGLYRVKLTGTIEGDLDVILPIFPTLITSAANDFKSFACDDCGYINDCGCNDLSNVAKRSVKYNTLTSKILYLETNIINDNASDIVVTNYNEFLLSALQSVSCKSEGLLKELLRLECLTGSSMDNELYELLITLKFIGIYLVEKNSGNDLIIQENETMSIPDLYLYDEWKDCICKTCLRLDELISIYEEGVIIVDPEPTNFPPTAANIVREVQSSTDYFNYNLLPLDFGNVYSDVETSLPVTVKIVALPATFILETVGDVAITAGQVIQYTSLINIRCNHTDGGEPPIPSSDFFKFSVSDGVSYSPVYTFTLLLIRVVNNPPIISRDFNIRINLPNNAFLTKDEMMYLNGFVYDPEGDEITLAKVHYISKCSLELWDGSVYQPYTLNDVITLADFANTSPFLRITYEDGFIPVPSDIRGLETPAFRVSFLDAGSNIYSNSIVVTNFMNIGLDVIHNSARLVFTGGYNLLGLITKANWIPLARIEYDGEFKDLSIVLISQTGYVSTELPFVITKAKEDTVYDIYDNASSIVVSGTKNPDINSYDILVNTNVLNTRAINYKLVNTVGDLLTINSSILVESYGGNNNPISVYFLEFDETNIVDFDALEVSIPEDFIVTVPNPALELDYDVITLGQILTITSVGLIGFALETDKIRNPRIFDSLGNDVTTTAFKKFFDAVSGLEVYISYGVYTPSTLYLKLKF